MCVCARLRLTEDSLGALGATAHCVQPPSPYTSLLAQPLTGKMMKITAFFMLHLRCCARSLARLSPPAGRKSIPGIAMHNIRMNLTAHTCYTLNEAYARACATACSKVHYKVYIDRSSTASTQSCRLASGAYWRAHFN